MAQKGDVSPKTVEGLWPLNEQIEEVRGKIHLQERDLKAYLESAEERKEKNEALILQLRQENRQKRSLIQNGIMGDKKVIHNVFNSRKEELLAMKSYTCRQAINTMDVRVCEAKKYLNELKYESEVRQSRLQELQEMLARLIVNPESEADKEGERRVHQLQNDLDKARIKYETAKHITNRYNEILNFMQEECRNYPSRLDALEEAVIQARRDSKEMTALSGKACTTSEVAKRQLMTTERELYRAKKSRDQLLNQMKKEVERRREPTERYERRGRPMLSTDAISEAQSRKRQNHIQRQQRVLNYEDAFEKIKDSVKVSDINDVVFRVANQDNTREQLQAQEKEFLTIRRKLGMELEKLREAYSLLRYEGYSREGERLVEEMKGYTEKAEERRDNLKKKLDDETHLVVDIQLAVSTLYQKLWNVKLKPPFHNYSRGDPLEDLHNCGRKINVLQKEIGKEGRENLDMRLKSLKFQEFMESRLPPDNFKVKVVAEDEEDDDYLFDHDIDNEKLLTRDDIKRRGNQLLEAKLKTRKKKGKKGRA
ncbi:outer dynein arm-docking complex subunit 3-like [Liolophura sinensis]|uniref:outer dynein arm-docking complex subunit 3-like n=1 Tax=Liolophura sinensis TaxID=3198878 RepID=UPI0031588E46